MFTKLGVSAKGRKHVSIIHVPFFGGIMFFVTFSALLQISLD